MNTETMITELNAVAEKHKNDFVPTFQTNISAMCRDIIPKLKQLAEYEKIGTTEEIKEILQIISEGQDDVDESGISTGLLHTLLEYAEYAKIGTVEECREARERQRARKPILCMNEKSGMFVDYADGHGEYKTQMNNWWRCPCCNEVVGQRVIAHKHIHDQRKKNFCEKCGQAISWERDTD